MDYFNQLLDSYALLKQRKLKVSRRITEQETKTKDKEKEEPPTNPQAVEQATAALQDIMRRSQGGAVRINQWPDTTHFPPQWEKGTVLGRNEQGDEVILWKSSADKDIMMRGTTGHAAVAVGTNQGQPLNPEAPKGFKTLVNYFAGMEGGSQDEPAEDPKVIEARDRAVNAADDFATALGGLGNDADVEMFGKLGAVLGGEQQGIVLSQQRLQAQVDQLLINTTDQPPELKAESLNAAADSLKTAAKILRGKEVFDKELAKAAQNMEITKWGVQFGPLFINYRNRSTAENDPLRHVADTINGAIKERNAEFKGAPDYAILDEIPHIKPKGADWDLRGKLSEHHLVTYGLIRSLDDCLEKGGNCTKEKNKIKASLEEAIKQGTAQELMELFNSGQQMIDGKVMFDLDKLQDTVFVQELRDYYTGVMGLKEPTVDALFEAAGEQLGVGLVLYAHATRQADKDLLGNGPQIKAIERVGSESSAQQPFTKADNNIVYDSKDKGKVTKAWQETMGEQGIQRAADIQKRHPDLPIPLGVDGLVQTQGEDTVVGLELKVLTELSDKAAVGELGDQSGHKVMNGEGRPDVQKVFNEMVTPTLIAIGVNPDRAKKQANIIAKETASTTKTLAGVGVKGVDNPILDVLADYKTQHSKDQRWDAEKFEQLQDYVQNPAGKPGEDPNDIEARKKAYKSWTQKAVQGEVTQMENEAEGVDSNTETRVTNKNWRDYHLTNIAIAGYSTTEVVKDSRRLSQNKQSVYCNNLELTYAIEGCTTGTHKLLRKGKTIHIINRKTGKAAFTGSYERGRLRVTSGKDVGNPISTELSTENSSHQHGTGDLMIEFLRGQQKLIDQLLV